MAVARSAARAVSFISARVCQANSSHPVAVAGSSPQNVLLVSAIPALPLPRRAIANSSILRVLPAYVNILQIKRFNMNRILFSVCARFCLVSFILLSFVLQLPAQPAVRKKKEAATLGATQPSLEQKVAALDAYIAQAREDWKVPGLAVAIVQGDKVLLSKGYGVLQTGATQAVNEHSLFAIASNSKAFTSAALAMLVDEGKLHWDDRVSQHLPWFRLRDPWASADIRVRDLLCHRSGLGTFSGDLLWWGTSYSAREVLERAALLEPAAPFRTKYEYSNLMFIAAGEVIRAVSGLSWEQFVEQRIFSPLNMSRSVTSTTDLSAKGNFATPHKTYTDRNQPIEWMNWDVMGAAGGVISSVHDMSKWMQCQLAQGEAAPGTKALFTKARSREMWEAHMPIPVSEGSRRRFPSTHFRAYALGWSLSDYLGHKLVGHGGGYDGMYSQVLLAPEKGLGVVVLTNSMTGIGSAITYRVMDTFLGGAQRDWSGEMLPGALAGQQAFEARIRETITPAATGTQASQAPAAYTGLYRCPMYGDTRVELENGRLVMRLLPYPELVADLVHLHYDTYEVRWRKDFAWFGGGTVQFVPDSRGRFVRLSLDIPNDDLWFYELKLERVE